MQKGELRREIADHLVRIDLVPILQHDAPRAAVDNFDVLDTRVGPDLNTPAARRCRDRFGDRAHASAHEAPQSAMPSHASHHVMQQDVSGAGRAWTAVRSNDAVGGQRHFDLARFKPFVQKLHRALREDLDQPDDLLGAEAAHLSRELQIIDEIARPLWRELRRRGEQQAFHHLREPLQMVLISGEHRRVVPGKFRDFLQRPGAILPHEQMAAVGKGRKERGVLGVHAIAEARQFQIANHALLQQAGQVRSSGDVIARPDFFGDRAPAHQFAAFQHQYATARLSKIGGTDQAVVPGSNDDCVRFLQISIVA